jgi:hypothetical protein
MQVSGGGMVRRVLLCGVFVCATLIVAKSVRFFFESRLDLKPYVVVPRPPLTLSVSQFSCVNSSNGMTHVKRTAVLHGPDWILESLIKPSCLPESDLVLSFEISRLLVNRRVTVRTRLWVTRKRDVTYVRIVESSGSEEQDMIAVGLTTNHRCTTRRSKGCRIEGGPILVSID